MTVRENVDIDKLEQFRTFLLEHPDEGVLGIEAVAVYEGQAGRSTIHVGPFAIDGDRIDRPTRHYTFAFGAWRELEERAGHTDATDRMEPVEMALAACAACLNTSISVNAARLGIKIANLETTIRQDVDPRVLFAIKDPEEHDSCLGGVEVEIKVSGRVSDEDVETIGKLATHSPVYGLIAGPNTVTHQVVRA
jgi:uncharacterized OsmC-like protein